MTHYRAPQNKALGSPAIADQPDEKFAYFPAFVKVQGKKVVVIGGGDVAAGKLRLLMRSHADITVIAPELCDDIARMHANGKIRWESSPFVDTMINGAAMVFDASDNPHLTTRVEAAAKRRNILLNVVDKTAHCDFIVPAILDRAPVMITISTGACAPALARILRQRLETVFPATLSNIAKIARDARDTVLRLELADRRPHRGVHRVDDLLLEERLQLADRHERRVDHLARLQRRLGLERRRRGRPAGRFQLLEAAVSC